MKYFHVYDSSAPGYEQKVQAKTGRPLSSSVASKIPTSKYIRYAQYDKNRRFTELLDTLPEHISVEELVEFYRKISRNFFIRSNDLKYRKFQVLQECTETLLPDLNTAQVSDILIALLPSKAVHQERLMRNTINEMLKRDLPFGGILMIDFMLHKYYTNFHTELRKDYDNLRMNLQKSFLLKVEHKFKNMQRTTDSKLCMKLVSYCMNNIEIIPPKVMNCLTTSLLSLDHANFSVQDITTVLRFISYIRRLDEPTQKLLQTMFDAWIKSEITAHQVDALLQLLVNSDSTADKERFTEPRFIEKCVNVVKQQNDKKVLFNVQNSINQLVSFRIKANR